MNSRGSAGARLRTCCLNACIAYAAWLAGAGAAVATDPEDRTLVAMCRGGLAESACLYAESQLKHTLDLSLRAKWCMRLMECHAQAAMSVAGQDEDSKATAAQHWLAAETALKEFAAARADDPRMPWLVWQNARCHLLHAQSALATYLAAPANSSVREVALSLVRDVMSETEGLLDDLKRRQPLAARQGRQAGGEATPAQLSELGLDVALLQCEALLVRARLYDAGSADRIAAATDVETRAAEILTRSADTWSGHEQLSIARALAQLELGQDRQALLSLEAIAGQSTNLRTQGLAALFAIERLAANGEVSRAQPLLAYLDQAKFGAELALAKLQLGLAQARDLPQAERQAALNGLVTNAKSIGQRFGDYWQNRAEALLVGALSGNTTGNATVALNLMLAEVRQLLAAQDIDGAVERLFQFRDNEAAAGRGETAIRFASQAAALLNQQQRWSEAVAALEPFVLRFPAAGQAAEAHMLVNWTRAQALRQMPQSPQLGKAYEESLVQQMMLWPDAAASDEAQDWLSNWLIAQTRRSELVGGLRSRVGRCLDSAVAQRVLIEWLTESLRLHDRQQRQAQLQAMRSSANECLVAEIASLAAFYGLVADVFSDWPIRKQGLALQEELAVAASKIQDTQAQQLLRATQLLTAIRTQESQGLDRWVDGWQPAQLGEDLRNAISPAFVAAVDEASIDEHRGWLEQLRVDEPWIECLQGSPLPQERACGLRFTAWLHNATHGLDGLSELTAEFPRDGDLQMQLSQALAASGSNRLSDSSRIARRIVASSLPASQLNLTARWRLIRNESMSGNQQAAHQAAQLLLTTLPAGDSVWRQRLESIQLN